VVQQGERVVCVRHVYPDTYRLFQQLLPRFGIRVDYVDGRDADAVAAALPGARLLYLESPTTLV
jgi:cystathionine beta-lyase/cystathionine gamma-synthase